MSKKIFSAVIILSILVFMTMGMFSYRRLNRSSSAQSVPATTTPVSQTQVADPPGTIDGAKSPELIQDDVAYLMMLRLIASHSTELEKHRVRSYIKHLGLGVFDCIECPRKRSPDTDVDLVMDIAAKFRQETSDLEQRVKEIKEKNWPNPSQEALQELGVLENRFNVRLHAKVIELKSRLSIEGRDNLSESITKGIKPKIKIYPGPSSFPGGGDWKRDNIK
jgi:hypothetical protein